MNDRDVSLSTDQHEGHGPGQCRPSCPVWETKSPAWQDTQMTSQQMLAQIWERAAERRASMIEAGLCPVCGQPDNCGDCNHRPLTEAEWARLGRLANILDRYPERESDD